jgi:dTDP-4-dehydrorhamnose 3,5-epimerase
LIEGVAVKEIRVHPDARGRLFEILRADEGDHFSGFGQVYATTTYPGVVKAWHLHRKQTDFFCCVRGMIRLVLFDDREDSPTRGELNEWCMGEHRMIAVKIPPHILHGFQCIGQEEAMVINTVTHPFSPAEPDEYRIDPHDNDIPFSWARRDG